jgi:hypothetical protein
MAAPVRIILYTASFPDIFTAPEHTKFHFKQKFTLMFRIVLLHSLNTNFILAPAIKRRHNILQDYSSRTPYPLRMPVAGNKKLWHFFHESNIIISLEYSCEVSMELFLTLRSLSWNVKLKFNVTHFHKDRRNIVWCIKFKYELKHFCIPRVRLLVQGIPYFLNKHKASLW